MELSKTCVACRETKAAEDFHPHPKNRDGLHQACKACHRDRMRRRTRSLNEGQREQQRDYHRKRRVAGYRPPKSSLEVRRARNAVSNALRDGKISRDPCFFCSSEHNLQAHHRDYSRPLDVVWLCAKCHARLHSILSDKHTQSNGARA